MQREISRLDNYLKRFPDIEIWIISKTQKCARYYWALINQYIETNKKPRFISKENMEKHGCNTFNSIILLCGHWYENPIAFSEVFKMHLNYAKFTLPIGEMPDTKKLEGTIKSSKENSKINNLSLEIKITDTDIFEEFIILFKQVIEDDRVPDEVKIETIEKLNTLLDKYKTE
jgi:hypothetical protein